MTDLSEVEWRQWYRVPTYRVGNNGLIIRPEGFMLTYALDKDGYPFPYIPALKTRVFAHVIVCEAWHGPRPSPLYQVAHENGVKTDLRAENLSWKTCSENHLDKRRHGTDMIGIRNGRHKLTEDDVRAIRSSVGVGARTLAKQFNVSRAAVRFVLDGTTWKHVV